MSERFIRILAESVMSIESAVNLIVIKTISASAQAAARPLIRSSGRNFGHHRRRQYRPLVIARSEEAVESVVNRFHALIKR